MKFYTFDEDNEDYTLRIGIRPTEKDGDKFLEIFYSFIPTDEDGWPESSQIKIPVKVYNKFKALLGEVEAAVVKAGWVKLEDLASS